jgi:hypothetical protein
VSVAERELGGGVEDAGVGIVAVEALDQLGRVQAVVACRRLAEATGEAQSDALEAHRLDRQRLGGVADAVVDQRSDFNPTHGCETLISASP